ncbi:MAG: 4a-hydroxytetrahydrobiopterin dehydratase [Bacteroidales bacterium]|nr:4a-hydroxytetrahydrobiopterin dehydratase [Bacteroidales bacterium]
MKLTDKKCLPCEGGMPPLASSEISRLKAEISPGWEVVNQHHLVKTFYFVNFRHTFDFVTKLAELAETEGHHPVIHIYYDKAVVEIWTHAIDGLSENDFILAAKTDLLLSK